MLVLVLVLVERYPCSGKSLVLTKTQKQCFLDGSRTQRRNDLPDNDTNTAALITTSCWLPGFEAFEVMGCAAPNASALQDLTHRPRRLKISHRKKIARRYFPCDVNKTESVPMGPTAVGRETRTRTFRDMGKSTDTGAIQAPPRGVAMAMICRWYQRTVSSRPSGVLLGAWIVCVLCFHPRAAAVKECDRFQNVTWRFFRLSPRTLLFAACCLLFV